MVNYRRNRVAGGTYFFTLTLRDRHASTLVDHIDALRQAFRTTRHKRPFELDAIVVLPEHLHAVWTLPPDDNDYSSRWRSIKSLFTKALKGQMANVARNRRGEHDLWQRRYWEHTVRNEEDLRRHIDYLHFNPVKHGLVNRVRDWPYSSFHRFVQRGLYDNDWGGGGVEGKADKYGER